jgi:hypothetical protein
MAMSSLLVISIIHSKYLVYDLWTKKIESTLDAGFARDKFGEPHSH